MGLDPNKTKEVKFDICGSLEYNYNLEDIILKDLET